MNIHYLDSKEHIIKNITDYHDQYDKVFIISQKSILSYQPFIKQLGPNIYFCDENEQCKSIIQYEKIISYLHDNKCNKNSIIIGVGGGAVTDFCGYTASTYMRGIDHVFIPTTLLAMADAAIGGKTALNYKGIRNLLGTYKNPKDIIISTDFISTLSQENIRNGCAEIIKYALIMDSNLFENIEENIANIFPNPDINIITPIIKRCINHKMDIVNQDQYDQNIRNILNFGHTLGHALESYYDFKMSHGEAILYGMRVASHLSKKANYLNDNDYQRIIKLIGIFKLSKLKNFDSDQIMSYINNDKKNIGDELNYILLKNIGTAVIEKNYNKDLIKEGLKIL